MRRYRITAASLVCTAAVAAVAACGGGTPAGTVASAPVATSASPGSSRPAGSGSGAPSGSSSPSEAPQPTALGGGATSTGPAPTSATCLSGSVRVVYPGSDNPLRRVCVHAGTLIVVTLTAVPSYKWAPVRSSDPTVVLMLANHAAEGGMLVEIGRAEAPGTATLSSADTFTPDPHGPPSRLWQLTVTVVP